VRLFAKGFIRRSLHGQGQGTVHGSRETTVGLHAAPGRGLAFLVLVVTSQSRPHRPVRRRRCLMGRSPTQHNSSTYQRQVNPKGIRRIALDLDATAGLLGIEMRRIHERHGLQPCGRRHRPQRGTSLPVRLSALKLLPKSSSSPHRNRPQVHDPRGRSRLPSRSNRSPRAARTTCAFRRSGHRTLPNPAAVAATPEVEAGFATAWPFRMHPMPGLQGGTVAPTKVRPGRSRCAGLEPNTTTRVTLVTPATPCEARAPVPRPSNSAAGPASPPFPHSPSTAYQGPVGASHPENSATTYWIEDA